MRPVERVWIVLLAAISLACQPADRGRPTTTDSPDEPVEFDIPIVMNRDVERWLDYYKGQGRASFEITLARAGRYERPMRAILRRKGLPEDLVYLSLIESGFHATAYSRARALGLWQFVPATARLYDLEMNQWVDERLDPIAATHAAAEYLEDLHREFGDWYLAVAAYNGGPGRVNRAIRRGGSRDFWTLAEKRLLLRETRDYVPKLIAAALLAKDPRTHGLRARPHPTGTFDFGYVLDATSLDVVAEAADVPFDEILALNLHLIRGVTPPGVRYRVRLPPGRARLFTENYARVAPSDRVRSVLHLVRRGETLGQIARRYGTSISRIRTANDGLDPSRLLAGQRIVVPEARNVPGLAD